MSDKAIIPPMLSVIGAVLKFIIDEFAVIADFKYIAFLYFHDFVLSLFQCREKF